VKKQPAPIVWITVGLTDTGSDWNDFLTDNGT